MVVRTLPLSHDYESKEQDDRVHRFNCCTETLVDIKRNYRLYCSLLDVLRDEYVDFPALRPIMHRYVNLHSLCSSSFDHLQMDIYELDLTDCIGIFYLTIHRVASILVSTHMKPPGHLDNDLQAAKWEVAMQRFLEHERPFWHHCIIVSCWFIREPTVSTSSTHVRGHFSAMQKKNRK